MLSRRRFIQLSTGVAAFGLSTASYGVGIEPLLRLRVVDYQVHPQRWPTGLTLKIAAIADVHACHPWMSLAHIETIVAHTNALRPDIIVMLGDYVAGHRRFTGRIEAPEWQPCWPA